LFVGLSADELAACQADFDATYAAWVTGITPRGRHRALLRGVDAAR